MDIISKMFSSFQIYNGAGLQIVYFVVALLFLYFNLKELNKRSVLIRYTIFIFVLIICPITAKIIIDYCIGEEVYWRMFWLLPISIVIAFVLVILSKKIKNPKKELLFIAVVSLFIVLSGDSVYQAGGFKMADNLEKLPEQVIKVSNIINKDANLHHVKIKKAVFPNEMVSYVRQYDATIYMPYGRNAIRAEGLDPTSQKIFDQMNQKNIDPLLLSGSLKAGKCNYLVLSKKQATVSLKNYDYYEVGKTKEYVVYRCDKLDTHEWRIIQYPNDQNAMFYTIQSDSGGLIVVDGGWVKDADYVRGIIASLGNHVDAWIVTHPHKDHAGAFCAIYPDLRGMVIDKVYTPKMPSEQLCQQNAPWDTFETLEAFNKLNITQLTYVHRGDSIDTDGLGIKVLSAYDDYVDQESNDLLNDGSIMFMVSGKTQKMLFCADVGVSMSNDLLNAYGNSLKADYLQMGHHGNGGLSKAFYDTVDPKVAFFDAPEWLMNPSQGSNYTTPQNKKIMQDLGAKVYYYATAPNTIVLK